MIRLYIKGDEAAARRALAQHLPPKCGLTVAALKIDTRPPLLGSPDYRVSDCYVDDRHHDAIARWYSEDNKVPYPPGALLHYQLLELHAEADDGILDPRDRNTWGDL